MRYVTLVFALPLIAACGPTETTPTARRIFAPLCHANDAGPAPCRVVQRASPSDGGREAGIEGTAGSDANTNDGGTGDAAVTCSNAFVGRLSALLDEWPKLTRGIESRSFSSFDRTGGNSDGFDGTYSQLYENEAGEHVIFDAMGPGVLDTLWFTGPDEGGAGLNLGTVRFYLDDETAPRLAVPWEDLFRGDYAPFLSPLVADNTVTTGAFASFVPIAYAQRLIVTTEKLPGFYQAHYETLPRDQPVSSFDPCEDVGPAQRAFDVAARFSPRQDVVTEPLDVTKTGAGVLDTIQFKPDHTPTDAELGSARIQITWDGQPEAAVDAPLGSFFGSGLGSATVHALAFSMDAGVYETRFRMPYRNGFHLQITGISGTLALHVDATTPTRDEGYFHAAYREANPTVAGEDFEWLSGAGAGKLVGTVLTVKPATPTTKKWWEGDLRSYANGRRTPSFNGTGHEDDHLGGWSDTFFKRPFSLPMNGEPRADIIDTTGQLNANATMYRFYPGIEFLNGVGHSTEHGSRNTVSGDYAGVAFYYSSATPSLVQTDALVVADESARAAHRYAATAESAPTPLTSSFEGRDDRTAVTSTVVAHSGVADLDVALAAGNAGCFLRRLYDQNEGRQRATISVDGEPVGDWYTAEGNQTLRWAERDYFLPASVTANESSAHVTVAPVADSPAWAVAEYRVLCVIE